MNLSISSFEMKVLFFFQAEDVIRDDLVTGVQTCALPIWRRAEAKHIASRVRELVDTGAATPGEIVLLFAAGTDAEWYEEELRALDLPTYRATGRGYFEIGRASCRGRGWRWGVEDVGKKRV